MQWTHGWIPSKVQNWGPGADINASKETGRRCYSYIKVSRPRDQWQDGLLQIYPKLRMAGRVIWSNNYRFRLDSKVCANLFSKRKIRILDWCNRSQWVECPFFGIVDCWGSGREMFYIVSWRRLPFGRTTFSLVSSSRAVHFVNPGDNKRLYNPFPYPSILKI